MVVLVLLAAAGAAAGVAAVGTGHATGQRASGGVRRGPGSTASAARVFLGPQGVESTAVVAENRRAGTRSWQIPDSGAPAGTIEGFADRDYAAAGDTVDLYVSTSAPSFTVIAYRMGWYGGTGARQVWQSPPVPGVVQPPCPLTPGINMVACDGWARSLAVPVTRAFVPGDYLLKLVGSGGQESYVLLVVWDPASTATYLVMARTFTEAAWNTFGGYSFYQGTGPCPPGSSGYPVCNRARVASLDRPMTGGHGASDFLSNEYPLVRFAEQHGLDVTYCTDITLDEHPGFALDHKALLSLGHDEMWSDNEREAAQQAFDHGVNMVFFGAAAVLRHTRLQASPLGPDREVVDYRDSTEDPLNGKGDPKQVTGNTWSSPPASWPETGFVGQVYAGYLLPTTPAVPLVVSDASAWLYRGTGLHDGDSVPRVVVSDIDHLDPGPTMPSDIEVLAHSPVSLAGAYTNQGKWDGRTYSDVTYYTSATSRAGVFDGGTVNWVDTLAPCPAGATACPGAVMGTLTGNLLWLFGQGPAGTILPSKANWQSVTPAGS